MPTDWSARYFQNDLGLFYGRVVAPSLKELGLDENLKMPAEFTSIDEGLEFYAKHTTNLVSYEARRCFALTLVSIFERQLQQWAYDHFPEEENTKVAGSYTFNALVKATSEHYDLTSIDEYSSIRETIEELRLLANAVRHGDGPSLKELRRRAPRLWQATPTDILRTDEIKLLNRDFIRYIDALGRFWALADFTLHPADALIKPYFSESDLSGG